MMLGTHHTEESKERLSLAHIGKVLSREHKKRIREALMCSDVHEKLRHTEEGNRRISESKKGDKNPMKSQEARAKSSTSHMGKSISDETRWKISIALKGRTFSDEHRRKLSERIISEGTRRRLSESRKGKSLSEETRRKVSKSRKGKCKGVENPNWNEGSSFGKYCPKFNNEFKERVRAFFGYICVVCKRSQEENGRRLNVHHVNYRKEACCDEDIPRHFVLLCDSCHANSNNNREDWKKRFTQIIEKRYGGRCYFRQGEQLIAYGVV
jgi:hypothetical protein